MAQSQVFYRTVAISGQAADPGDPGVVFNSFETPAINDLGRVVFKTAAGGAQRIYVAGPGGFDLVAQSGAAAPGTIPGVNYLSLTSPILTNDGAVVFQATLTGAGVGASNNEGVWRRSGGTTTLALREGDQAAGEPPGANYQSPFLSVKHSGGRISLHGNLIGIGETPFAGLPGDVRVVARDNEQAPGLPPGVQFVRFTVDGSNTLHNLDASGNVVFRATVDGPGWTQQRGIWRGQSGGLSLVAARGTPAPGLGSGVTFSGSFSEPWCNDNGQVAFSAHLAGVSGNQTQGLWAGEPDNLRLVTRIATPLPDLPANQFIGSLLVWNPLMSGSGRVGFAAPLSGAGVNSQNDSSLWLETEQGLRLVARENEPVPGLLGDVRWDSFVAEPVLNSPGQMAFTGIFRGLGVDASNNEALFLTDTSGLPYLIAREGDPFEVAPGDIRIIDQIFWTINSGGAGEDGRASGLSDNGELVYRLIFRNGAGQGIFTAYIPEPATAIPVTLIVLLSKRFRHRRDRTRRAESTHLEATP